MVIRELVELEVVRWNRGGISSRAAGSSAAE